MLRWTGIPVRRSCLTSRAIAFLGACGAAACVTAAPAPATRPAAELPALPVAVDPLTAPWIPEITRRSVSQELRLDASLVSRVDSVERVDTIRTVLTVEWSRVSGDDTPRVSGLITGFRNSTDTLAPATPSGLLLPMPFSALDAVGTLPARLTRPEPSGCGLEAAAALGVRELLLAMPRRLELGTTWTDSARYTICRDSIPLIVESVRDFRVTGAERGAGGIVVLVTRHSRVTMRGEGRQYGEALVIEAAGEGTAHLVVRLAGAYIERGSGETTLRMTMRGRRRSQELTQRTRIEILTP